MLAAAKVGGILANDTYPDDFLSENLQIQLNVMDAALKQRVERLLFLGSSCIYPKLAPQPIREDALMTGHLEPTNDAYAIAKIAGILQVQATRRQHGLPWISAMPTNLYGPGDNFPDRVPRLARPDPPLRRGGPRRARPRHELGSGGRAGSSSTSTTWPTPASHLLEHYDGPEQVNVGTGKDATIAEIADFVAVATGFEGGPVGTPPSPTGPPRSCSTYRDWRTPDGSHASVFKRAWSRPRSGSRAVVDLREVG